MNDDSNLPAIRNRGVGASDAATILNLNPYRTRMELFYEKTGQGTPVVENLAMKVGKALEGIVLDACSEAIGYEVKLRGYRQIDKVHPWRWVTLDGVAGDAIVEAKTANSLEGWGEPMTDQIPPGYVCQVQHALDVTNAEVCWVPVLFGAREFRLYTVRRDPDLGAAILKAEQEFWDHVERNEPPPLQSPAELRIRWPQDTGTEIVATPDIEAQAYAIGAVKGEIGKLDANLKALQGQVQTFMQDHATLVDEQGTVLCTWKTPRAPTVFDEETFKHAHPDLWRQFLVTGKAARRFLVKV
jgi:putative phage-type endonuclease